MQAGKNVLILHDSDVPESGIVCINLVKSFLYEKLFVHEPSIHEYIHLRISKNISKRINDMISEEEQKTVNILNNQQNVPNHISKLQ